MLASFGRTNENTIKEAVKICRKCPFGRVTKTRVPGRTIYTDNIDKPKYPVMFVSDYPGEGELRTKVPLSGKTGILFRQYLKQVLESHIEYKYIDDEKEMTRFDLEFFYVTNVLKCKPQLSQMGSIKSCNPRPTDIKSCSSHLTAEISYIKPKVILAAGRYAVSLLAGIKNPVHNNYRLKTYSCAFNRFIDVIATFNPAAILYIQGQTRTNKGPSKEQLFLEDLEYFTQHLINKGIIKDGKSKGNENNQDTDILF